MDKVIKIGGKRPRQPRIPDVYKVWADFMKDRSPAEANAARVLMLGYLLSVSPRESVLKGISFLVDTFDGEPGT